MKKMYANGISETYVLYVYDLLYPLNLARKAGERSSSLTHLHLHCWIAKGLRPITQVFHVLLPNMVLLKTYLHVQF